MANKVIMFTATWCQTCQPVKQTILKMKGFHPDVQFDILDADESMDTSRYGVRGLPTLVFEKDGEEVGRLTGQACQRRIEEYLKRF